MDLSVIVVTYNNRDLIGECLASCHRSVQASGLSAETIVVDNASNDGTADAAIRSQPGVSMIRNEINKGFAAANNQAMARSSGDRILFLNPDTITSEAAVGCLIQAISKSNPSQIGSASPSLRFSDGSFQHSAFRFPTLASMVLDVWTINHRLTGSRLNGRYSRDAYGEPFEIDYPLGACFMITRSAWNAVGPLDDLFFLYYEEVDWFLRLREAGLRAWCIPEAVVVHLGAQSTSRQPAAMWGHLQRSKLRYFSKHASRWQQRLVKSTVMADCFRRLNRARRRHRGGKLSDGELADWRSVTREVAKL